MQPSGLFEVLAEIETSPPRCVLEEEYGAALRLDSDRVAVNFVSTIDGIVSFGKDTDDSRAVGGGIAADRTLMAMLRSVAGVIVVGVGTLRATTNHQWTPRALAPERAADMDALRAAAGLPADPAPLLVVSGSNVLPRDAEAVGRPAVPLHVLSADGVLPAAEALARTGAPTSAAPVSAAAVVEAARQLSEGGPVLCEGGPHLFGTLLDGRVPIDLFLTVAPQLAGRSNHSAERRSLVEGVALPSFTRRGTLRSVRRADNHLLLRYRIDAAGNA
ncbi:MAG: dihydrofolate reductase family protein [Candidatus Dormibacteraeota bacterium]|uniref:Dihydrofolate reductase family protein n=1 Tax=Candidatus Aeolococcus gillhamiae TaxID=3127015 RepID=A0A934JVM3_9BACT|nr:dihydrofolate reductase family protein [Candidatus Dormibacteraeota bacterium]